MQILLLWRQQQVIPCNTATLILHFGKLTAYKYHVISQSLVTSVENQIVKTQASHRWQQVCYTWQNCTSVAVLANDIVKKITRMTPWDSQWFHGAGKWIWEGQKQWFCSHVAWDCMDAWPLGLTLLLIKKQSLKHLSLAIQDWACWVHFRMLQILWSLCIVGLIKLDNGTAQSKITCAGLLETAIPTAPCFAKELSAGLLAGMLQTYKRAAVR